eukprot:1195676-Prorocentrum_minimum.AAC.7
MSRPTLSSWGPWGDTRGYKTINAVCCMMKNATVFWPANVFWPPPRCNWPALRVYSLSPRVIGCRYLQGGQLDHADAAVVPPRQQPPETSVHLHAVHVLRVHLQRLRAREVITRRRFVNTYKLPLLEL